MADNFRLCPFCKKGEMRMHRRVVEGETKKPFWQKGESNQLVCDMCGHVIHDNELMERISIIDSVSAKVTKASELEARKKERRCSSCDEKKDIVFEKGDFRLCKECLDDFMKEHRFDK
jgi:hypothetical protein